MVSPSILRDAPLIFASDAFRHLLRLAERVAATDRPVLIEGESGTGKARIARIIHEMSRRRQGPFRTWHAAEANPGLVSSDLFGVSKGAFTGAEKDVEGFLETARGGSLVVDDIDKLPGSVQAQFLRYLDEGTGRRVGSTSNKSLDVRLIFTANRNLRTLANQGTFLPDLAYRILGFKIKIPPLRERREDIAPLLYHLIRGLAEELAGGCTPHLTPEALTLLERDPWLGNVREVAEIVQNLLLHEADDGLIDGDSVRRIFAQRTGSLMDAESELTRFRLLPMKERKSRKTVESALRFLGGNGRRAASALQIPERTFRHYLRIFGLTRRSALDMADESDT